MVNFVYFGLYLVCLIFLGASGIFTKGDLTEPRLFFFFYNVGQASLETAVFVLISYFLQKHAHRLFFFAFIGFTFLLLILHIIDAVMDRILDLSVWGAFQAFVLDETWGNFLYLLDASGISLWMWAVLFGGLIGLPFLGIFLYQATDILAKRYPLPRIVEISLIASVALPAALLFFDFSTSRLIHPNTYTAFIQSLPWKTTFLMPKHLLIQPAGSLLSPPIESAVQEKIHAINTSLPRKPNIYLFIVESLRKDILSEETTPNLLSFFDAPQRANTTLSNANGSQVSWFSIFHSQFSLYWKEFQQRGWSSGSPSLQLLKQLGYKIHLYSSAQLSYYDMESLLFGQKNALLDSYQTFHHAPPLSAADTDAKALLKLQEDIINNPSLQEGQVFIIFWDSTHFDYSWPKGWTPKFTPFANEFAYFKAFYSKSNINKIKNRYRNAVHYIDSLFGQFIETIKPQNYDIVIFTGDHGEEFFDHGHLFHGSHLTAEQTEIPLLMQFPKSSLPKQKAPITQMDIFPTIFDYLGVDSSSILQGESAFREKQRPFALVSRFNAGRTPYEFCFHNGQHKLIAQFTQKNNIFQSKALRVISLQTADDKIFPSSSKETPTWIEKEFIPIFSYLFPTDATNP